MLFCGTARRCTKQCLQLQPVFCIFVQCLVYLFIIFYFLYLFITLYFLYLFIIFFYICALFSILFHIFVHFFYICLYYELLVVASSNACNRLWTYLLNFFSYICPLFFVFFHHILYLFIIFYICLYLELLDVASSNACSRLWMIAGTTHFWRTSFCPSSVSSICYSDFKHSSAYWQCCSGVKMFQDLSAAEQQFFLRAVVIVQEDADGILQKRPNCS